MSARPTPFVRLFASVSHPSHECEIALPLSSYSGQHGVLRRAVTSAALPLLALVIAAPPLIEANQDNSTAAVTARQSSPDANERLAAVLKLASLRTPECIPALEAAVTDSSPMVRAAAVTALGNFRDGSLVAEIGRVLLHDKAEFPREQAAYALANFDSGEAEVLLVGCLNDKAAAVRGAAVIALAAHPNAAAIGPLSKSLSDSSAFVRAGAARALGSNGGAAREAVARLIDLLGPDSVDFVRREAAWALGRIGDPAAIPSLEKAEMSSDPYLSRVAQRAIEKLKSGA